MDGYTEQEIIDAGGSPELIAALERRRAEADEADQAAREKAKILAERRKELPTGVWMTRDGEEIAFEKLEDGHLVKILEHLRRRAIRDRLGVIYSLARYRPGGDAASDACEDAMAGFMAEDHPDMDEYAGRQKEDAEEDVERPWMRFVDGRWHALMDEAEKRKIKPRWTKAEDDKVRLELEGVTS